MSIPNIFKYATKELSQDAVICWLVACAAEATGDLQKCGLEFVRTLFRAGKSDRTGRWRWGAMQRCEAGLIQQRPGRFDAAKPVLNGWVLKHAGSYHYAGLSCLDTKLKLTQRRAIR